MEVVNLLDFLNKTKGLTALDFSKCDNELINFLDLLLEDIQLTQKVDFGIIYLSQKFLSEYIIVDGLNRLLSLSLLLHAICECYKKTTSKNEKAIQTIRSKYLFNQNKTKLRLNQKDQVIYEKILNGELLSGKEKKSPMFRLLHCFWTQIKEEKIAAAKIFNMLQKIFIRTVEVDDVPIIDLYVVLNKDNRKLNQLNLIESFMSKNNLAQEWNKILSIFKNNDKDIIKFFEDYFITKFNFKKFEEERLFQNYTNYFDSMLSYMNKDNLMQKIIKSAKLYRNIVNVDFNNEKIRDAIIKIKMHNGEDTYSYILNIYEDFIDGNLSEVTFLEILSTIDEYLKNRQKTQNNIGFNELIEYLNAFITCK